MLYSCALLGNYSIFTLQGDAIRNISGYFLVGEKNRYLGCIGYTTGVFQGAGKHVNIITSTRGNLASAGVHIEAKYTLPTTETENRPNNFNLKMWIKV